MRAEVHFCYCFQILKFCASGRGGGNAAQAKYQFSVYYNAPIHPGVDLGEGGRTPGAPPPPPFRAIMIREGGTFSSRSFSTDC